MLKQKQVWQTYTVSVTALSSLDTIIFNSGYTLDQIRYLVLNASSTGISLTLPTPSVSTGFTLTVIAGDEAITINGYTIDSLTALEFVWSGSAWGSDAVVATTSNSLDAYDTDKLYSVGDEAFYGNFHVTCTAATGGDFNWGSWTPTLPDDMTWQGHWTSSTSFSAGDVFYSGQSVYYTVTAFTGTLNGYAYMIFGPSTIPLYEGATSSLPGMSGMMTATAAIDSAETAPMYNGAGEASTLIFDETTSGTSVITTNGDTDNLTIDAPDALTYSVDGDLSINNSVTSGGSILLTSGNTEYPPLITAPGALGESTNVGYSGQVTMYLSSRSFSGTTRYNYSLVTLPAGVWRCEGSLTFTSLGTDGTIKAAIRENGEDIVTAASMRPYVGYLYSYSTIASPMLPTRIFYLSASTTIYYSFYFGQDQTTTLAYGHMAYTRLA